MQAITQITPTSSNLSSLSSITIPMLASVLTRLCPDTLWATVDISDNLRTSLRSSWKSNSSMMARSADEVSAEKVARLMVQYVNWDEKAEEANLQAILVMLCCLPSFRNLQKRLQNWFRAVPRMMGSCLSLFPGARASTTEVSSGFPFVVRNLCNSLVCCSLRSKSAPCQRHH